MNIPRIGDRVHWRSEGESGTVVGVGNLNPNKTDQEVFFVKPDNPAARFTCANEDFAEYGPVWWFNFEDIGPYLDLSRDLYMTGEKW